MSRIALVLAAGEGTRMKSDLPKVLHRLLGKPLVEWVLDAIELAGFDETVVIVGHKGDLVRKQLENRRVEFVTQEEQLGTGHAVLQAAPVVGGADGSVVVLSGDVPLVRAESLNRLIDAHEERGAAATMVTAMFDDPTGYGRVIRDGDGRVARVVEQKDATPDELAVREINAGTYCFDARPLFDVLPRISNDNAASEYYLPDVLTVFREGGLSVEPFVVDDEWEIFGINTPEHLVAAARQAEESGRG